MDAVAWERLTSVPVAVLATLNSDGTPHLVPFTFAPLSRGELVFAVDEKPKTGTRLRRLENIERDSRVGVLAHHYSDDWSELWWVRADADASVSAVEPPGASRLLIERYPDYASHTLGPWVTLTIRTLSTWAAAG